MKNDLKVITYYLPQFHSNDVNDKAWGKGFTEWDNVKKGKPLFAGHNQPRAPFGDNYYNLLDVEAIKWQVSMAKNHGIYGFAIYHYWFNGQLVLNEPVELIRDHPEINFPYMLSWANENWTDAWKNPENPTTFLQQTYGGQEEWDSHYEYLRTFFLDKNYIKNNNKPMLVIYRPEQIPDLNAMLDYWTERSLKDGFDGIDYAFQQIAFSLIPGSDKSRFMGDVEYEPRYAQEVLRENSRFKKETLAAWRKLKKALPVLGQLKQKITNKSDDEFTANDVKIQSYEELAKVIVNRKPTSDISIPGFFVGYDNTPRRGYAGTVVQSTPELFEKYFNMQVQNAIQNYKSNYLFLFAWNEWAEGGYLEPDSRYGTAYLDAIKRTMDKI